MDINRRPEQSPNENRLDKRLRVDTQLEKFINSEDGNQMFGKQIVIAKDLSLPIVNHDRDTHGDILRILQEEDVAKVRGIMHCFSGSWEIVQECVKLGFTSPSVARSTACLLKRMPRI